LPLLASLLVTSACGSLEMLGIKHKDGLEEVDDLLSYVERVQVESAVSKERGQAAIESLRAMVAPEFKGDPALAHKAFENAVEQSKEQAAALLRSVKPLRKTGESVFQGWAENLESFGNVAMRQRSQERLEETRKRYDAILAAAGSAQLAYDAFNRDLGDQGLFLEHDFNASAVALVAQELDGLKNRGRELAKRLDTCATACQAYVEFSAPSAEVSPPVETPVAPPPAAAAPAPISAAPTTAPAAKKPLPPKKKPAPKPAPAPQESGGG
jgi:ElaB/YqjD/DUF883 family membrane-anchored ribosome-binding protein